MIEATYHFKLGIHPYVSTTSQDYSFKLNRPEAVEFAKERTGRSGEKVLWISNDCSTRKMIRVKAKAKDGNDIVKVFRENPLYANVHDVVEGSQGGDFENCLGQETPILNR